MFVFVLILCVKAAMSGYVSSHSLRSFVCALLCICVCVECECTHLSAFRVHETFFHIQPRGLSPAQRCHLALARATTDDPRGAIGTSPRLLLTIVLGTAVRWTGANSPNYEQDDKTDLEAVMGCG